MALGLSLYAEVSQGDKAFDFKLKTLDNKKSYTMQSFKGEVVLLNLWASWCKGCKKEMPEFVALQNSYTKGFKLVTVNLDDDPKKAIKFLKSVEKKTGMKNPFISLYDPSKSLAKAYACSAMPSSYLIDKYGKIQNIMVGSLDAHDIEKLKLDINSLQ
ncbi:MAG: TlpA disulfide reductase family protein [Sulfurovum sp.]|nr:TlpA disulfide reductase family protein [Sulfurovum sp.]